MAHRARQLVSLIFRYAIATGRAERDPTADLKGALKNKKVKHHAAITDPSGVGRLLRDIQHYDGTSSGQGRARTVCVIVPAAR